MPTFRSDDIDIFYEVKGTGPNLLFISGTGADLRKRPSIFDSSIPDLFTLASYDQRGLGQSGKPDRPYSMAEYADDAVRFLDHLGWEKALVVGVSFGGMVAQHLAIRQTDRISKLALCCTSSGGAGGASYPLHTLQHLPDEERARNLVPLNDTRCTPDWVKENGSLYQAMVDMAVEAYEFARDEPHHDIGAFRQLEARTHHDTYDQLDQIELPVLLAAGKYDGIATPENQRALLERLPNAELEFYEGGHLFLLQDPKAWQSIISFLLR